MSSREKLLWISEARFLQAGCPPVTVTALLRWCSTKRRYIKCTYLYLFTFYNQQHKSTEEES